MKKQILYPLTVSLFALVFCLGMGHPKGAGRPQPVEIASDYILIPGTTISAEDQAAAKRILKKYDGSYYRIEFYENGSRGKHIGSMRQIDVGHGFSTDQAKKSGFSSWTSKIGMGCSPTRCTQSPTPTSGRDHSDDLVREITPVLQKYSK